MRMSKHNKHKKQTKKRRRSEKRRKPFFLVPLWGQDVPTPLSLGYTAEHENKIKKPLFFMFGAKKKHKKKDRTVLKLTGERGMG